MEGSQFNTNCTTFTVRQLKDINLTRGVTAIICAIVLIIIFVFLICNKAYKKRAERLLLYLLFGTVVTELIKALGMEHQFHYEHQEIVCKWLAFITYWSSSTMFTFTFAIIVHLITLVVSSILSVKASDNRILMRAKIKTWCCRCCELMTDMLFTIPPILLSFTLAWIPYIHKSYGIAGPFCWVKSTHYGENCTKTIDITDHMIYYGLYEVAGIVSVILGIIFLALYCKMRKSYPQFEKARKLLLKALTLMGFQVVYVITVSFQLFTRLYTAYTGVHKSYAVWIVYSLISPLRQLIFPVACLFTFFSLRKLRMFVLCASPYDRLSTQPAKASSRPKLSAKTVPDSTRVSAESSTFYIVPHPKSNDVSYGSTLEDTI